MNEIPSMEIDDHPVPDAVVAAFGRLVDRLDAQRILGMSSAMPSLFQGHRVLVQNAPVARVRMKSLLKNERRLDPYVATLLRGTGLARELVAVLSEAALQKGFADLAAYFGEPDFLAAALLDEREAVRDLAHDFIAGWDGQRADDVGREKAAEGIRSAFASFLAHVKTLFSKASPPASRLEKDQGQTATQKSDKALDAIKPDLDRFLTIAERKRKKLQDKITKKEKEIDSLQTDLKTARSESNTREEQLSEATEDLNKLRTSLQKRIEQGVGEALSGTLRKWLVPARNVEVALAGAKQSDLAGRAAEVLKRQHTVDLNYGNRAALAQLIGERRLLLAELQRARREALNPLPELRGIADQVEREIGDLEHRLELPEQDVAAAASGLLARTNEAQTLDELSEMRQFIQQAAAYELLHRKDLHRIYRALDDKAGLLYDKAEVFGETKGGASKTRFFLRLAVANGEFFTLFIDGHNVLFELKEVFGQYFADGLPGTKARVEFANRITRIFDKPGADVLLYFDGDDPQQHTLSDQVRIIYSGGTGEHRADAAILKHLMAIGQSGALAPLCLVTGDADFARQARGIGVIIMHPEEFAVSVDLAAA